MDRGGSTMAPEGITWWSTTPSNVARSSLPPSRYPYVSVNRIYKIPSTVRNVGHAIVDVTDNQKDPHVSKDWKERDDGSCAIVVNGKRCSELQ